MTLGSTMPLELSTFKLKYDLRYFFSVNKSELEFSQQILAARLKLS